MLKRLSHFWYLSVSFSLLHRLSYQRVMDLLIENLQDKAYAWGEKVERIFTRACQKRLMAYVQEEDVLLNAQEARKDANLDPLVPLSTCKKWYVHWEHFGECPTITKNRFEKERQKYATSRKGKRRWLRDRPADKMTDEVKAELLRIVEEDPIAYLDEMQERLAMSTNMWVSLKTLSTTLRDDLGWTLGVYSNKALQQDAQERAEYRELMDKLVLNTEQVLWVDETDKSYSASRRRCA